MSNRPQEMDDLKARIAKAVSARKNTSILVARLCSLRLRQLNEEMAMENTVTVERKIHEIECAVDDLTSLAHTASGFAALKNGNLEGIERRIRHLRFDLEAQQQAAE